MYNYFVLNVHSFDCIQLNTDHNNKNLHKVVDFINIHICIMHVLSSQEMFSEN